MSDLSDLQTIKSQIIANLKAATLTPKVSYSIDGQAVNWTQYQAEMRKQLKDINLLIGTEEGPFISETISFS